MRIFSRFVLAIFTLVLWHGGEARADALLKNGQYGNVHIYSRGDSLSLKWNSGDETDGAYLCSGFSCVSSSNANFVVTVLSATSFQLQRKDNNYNGTFSLTQADPDNGDHGAVLQSGQYGNVHIYASRNSISLKWNSGDETDGAYVCTGFSCVNSGNSNFVITVLSATSFQLQRKDNNYNGTFLLTQADPDNGDHGAVLQSGQYGNVHIYARRNSISLQWNSGDETDGGYICTGFSCVNSQNAKFVITVLSSTSFELRRLDNNYRGTFSLTQADPDDGLHGGLLRSGMYGSVHVYARLSAISLKWSSGDETDGAYNCAGFACVNAVNANFILTVTGPASFLLQRKDNGYKGSFQLTQPD